MPPMTNDIKTSDFNFGHWGSILEHWISIVGTGFQFWSILLQFGHLTSINFGAFSQKIYIFLCRKCFYLCKKPLLMTTLENPNINIFQKILIARRAYCVEAFSKSMCVRPFVRPYVRPSVRQAHRIGTGFSEQKSGFHVGTEI